jgi:alpha-galactosidase
LSGYSRRSFVGGVVAATVGGAAVGLGQKAHAADTLSRAKTGSSFCEIQRAPDKVTAYREDRNAVSLVRSNEAWHSADIEVTTQTKASGLEVSIAAPSSALTRVHLRWNQKVDLSILIMGDAWERSYGDLAWRTFVPERAMPWYFVTHAQDGTHGYGVRTGAAALCFWQIDREGVSLWLDVTNGGSGVQLGQRTLHAATVLSRKGEAAQQPFDAVTAFCRKMSPTPRLPKGPIYGCNDWYYAYGRNTAAQIYRDTELISSLSPTAGPRPFSVIDMGWEHNPAFGDMAVVAAEIRNRGARPGIWVRPLEATKAADPGMLLPVSRYGERTGRGAELAFDPTIPEALELALAKISNPAAWKYELIKHDFSTYDLFGQWGFEMGAQPTIPGWHFNDRSKTNAEIVLALYTSIRKAGGESIVLGCNTIGHLSAGLFELQRTGDDTSGQRWERTRRMGVNTLAYRLPQHETFFVQDADCVGITRAIPWALNRAWLNLLARSGTALFVSPAPDAIGEEQRSAMREAFAISASGAAKGRPMDWLHETTPEDWQWTGSPAAGEQKDLHYNWCGDDGCDPFTI